MWAFATTWLVGVASTLVGSALMRLATRAFLFFGIAYFSEVMLGNNPASSLIQTVLHPNEYVQSMGEMAFGPSGVVSWGNYILYLTDIWTPLRWFLSAAASWFIVRKWMSFGKG